MRRLVFIPFPEEEPPFRFGSDVDRMAAVLETRGFTASRDDLRLAWEDHSDAVCASWLSLPDDDEALAGILLSILKEA